jgi:hypothetical protein
VWCSAVLGHIVDCTVFIVVVVSTDQLRLHAGLNCVTLLQILKLITPHFFYSVHLADSSSG